MNELNSLYNVAALSHFFMDSKKLPALKSDLFNALIKEKEAAKRHPYSIQATKGGNDKFTIYFDVESDLDGPDSWVVADGLQAFYKGIEITDLFESCDLKEYVYVQSKEVEQQMDDRWAEHMLQQYAVADYD
jgi:hypothetical protein